MRTEDYPRSVNEQILKQQIGSEMLAYDQKRHQAFCLNPSSATIWGLCDGTRTVAQIAASASTQLQAHIDDELVRFALEALRKDGLLEPAQPSQAVDSVSRRDLLQRLGVGAAMLIPAVAMIVAPTAAQAYSGCVDCDSARPARQQRLPAN